MHFSYVPSIPENVLKAIDLGNISIVKKIKDKLLRDDRANICDLELMAKDERRILARVCCAN